MIDLDAWAPVAHDIPLDAGDGRRMKLQVATDDDWERACRRARNKLSVGAGRLEDGWTWEEGIARWACRYLSSVTWIRNEPAPRDPKMGRTPDAAAWAEQRPRWVDTVFAIAELGTDAQRIGFRRIARGWRCYLDDDPTKLWTVGEYLEAIAGGAWTSAFVEAAEPIGAFIPFAEAEPLRHSGEELCQATEPVRDGPVLTPTGYKPFAEIPREQR